MKDLDDIIEQLQATKKCLDQVLVVTQETLRIQRGTADAIAEIRQFVAGANEALKRAAEHLERANRYLAKPTKASAVAVTFTPEQEARLERAALTLTGLTLN